MTRRIEFDMMPSLSGQYLRAVARLPRPLRAKGVRGGKVDALPALEAEAGQVGVVRATLEAYRALCAIADTESLPVAYPQVLAAPLHAAIIAAPEFPFPALGLVHRRNVIVQHRAIRPDERLALRARLGEWREVAAGVEFDVQTVARVTGERVWESVMTVLVRNAGGTGKKSKSGRSGSKKRGATEPGESPGVSRSVILNVPESTGRRYGAISGDYNPIHLHAASARAFGFRRAIVHGMWSLARCLGELGDELAPMGAMRVEVDFKRPIELPSRVLFSSTPLGGAAGGGVCFAMKTHDGAKVYLEGRVQAHPR